AQMRIDCTGIRLFSEQNLETDERRTGAISSFSFLIVQLLYFQEMRLEFCLSPPSALELRDSFPPTDLAGLRSLPSGSESPLMVVRQPRVRDASCSSHQNVERL